MQRKIPLLTARKQRDGWRSWLDQAHDGPHSLSTRVNERHHQARLLLFLLSSSLVGALAVGLQRHVGGSPVATQEFAPLLLVALVSEATLYSAVFIVDYALTARAGLRAERGRTHQAQFLYMKLKQQVNPHFLINSLNILDCLVCEERTAQASDFIHKLAGIYRYMLQNEQEPLVPMERELAFVEKYVELLQVRFVDGFRVEWLVAPEARKRNVVPCSMQLLVENAIKHNAVDAAEPLTIRIVALPAIASVVKHQGTRLRISARPRPDFDMVVSRSRVDDFLKWLEGGL